MERASENLWPYLIYSRVVISHYKTFLIRIFSALSTPFPGVDYKCKLNIHKELPIITDFLSSSSDHQMASLLSQAGVLKVSTKFHLDVPLKLRTPVIFAGWIKGWVVMITEGAWAEDRHGCWLGNTSSSLFL